MRPKLDSDDLDKALSKIVGFEQRKNYGQALRLKRSDSSEASTKAVDSCNTQTGQDKQWLTVEQV